MTVQLFGVEVSSKAGAIIINSQNFKVDPTGNTFSDEGFKAAFKFACKTKKTLFLPVGWYNLKAGLVWDFKDCPDGFSLVGENHRNTFIYFQGSSSVGWSWKKSGAAAGTGPLEGGNFPYVYFELGKLFIQCEQSQACFGLGGEGGQDFFGSGNVHDLYVSNRSKGQDAVAIRLNNVGATVFTNVQTGVIPATEKDPGSGIGLQMVQAAFNTFNNLSTGNANIGISFTDLGNSKVGYNYGNVFIGADIENVQWAVIADNSTNSGSIRNTFIGGQFYTIFPGGALAANRQPSAKGCCGNLIFQDINNSYDDLNPLYPKVGADKDKQWGVAPFVHPQFYRGIQVRGYYPVQPRQISLPGSGNCFSNSVPNTTGQTQTVTVSGGQFSSVCWKGLTIPVTGTYTFPWEPGDTFGVGYTDRPQVFITPAH
jgi:hypothetical protein